MDWYLKVLKQYTRFNGRARRKEYWYFCLISFLISLFLTILPILFASLSQQLLSLFDSTVTVLALITAIRLLEIIYGLGVFLPSLAVTVRRLHDTGRSGWWCLISLIAISRNLILTLVVILILLYFLVQDSEPGANRFGRNPKEPVD